MDKFLDLVTDPYDRKARATPALLTVLPLVVPLVCQFGVKNPILTAVVGVLGTCGAIYAGANIARGRGKLLEEELVKDWGGLPTTALLRHRDGYYGAETKNRFHRYCVERLGVQMPTEAEEKTEPMKADGIYDGVARRLRELTRDDKKSLIFKENCAYGFHRNMLGLKPVGVISSVVGLVYGLALGGAIKLDRFAVDVHALAAPGLAGGLSILVSVVMLFAWLWYFSRRQVRVIGLAYAERLFEKLATLPKLRSGRPPLGPAPSAPTAAATPSL